MSTTLKKVTDKLGRLAYRTLKTPGEVARMFDTRDAEVMALAEALKVMLNGEFAPPQREWINRIEGLRAGLEASTREIVVDDFGALPHGQKLIPERPLGGRTFVRTIGEAAHASPSFAWCWLLFELVRRFQPAVAVELGAGVGISGAYLAAGMTLYGGGQLYTLEGADALVELARANFEGLDLRNIEVVLGRFQETLERQLRRVGPVDMICFDGHFEGEATRGYFETALPYLAPGALLFFNGIAHNDGMAAAWAQIIAHPRVDVAVDLMHTGLCRVTPGVGRHLLYKVVLG
jgi:precorrin-6B methylase 2